MQFVVLLLVSLAISVAVYLLSPKPKQPKTETADLQAPTVSAGRPCPVVFGTVKLKSANILWFGDKAKREYEVDA